MHAGFSMCTVPLHAHVITCLGSSLPCKITSYNKCACHALPYNSHLHMHAMHCAAPEPCSHAHVPAGLAMHFGEVRMWAQLIHRCRRFFPSGAAGEIWAEFSPALGNILTPQCLEVACHLLHACVLSSVAHDLSGLADDVKVDHNGVHPYTRRFNKVVPAFKAVSLDAESAAVAAAFSKLEASPTCCQRCSSSPHSQS